MKQTIRLIGSACFLSLVSLFAQAQSKSLEVAGKQVELKINAVAHQSLRISLLPIDAAAAQLAQSPEIDLKNDGSSLKTIQSVDTMQTVEVGQYLVRISNHPLRLSIVGKDGTPVQSLRIDEANGAVTFPLGAGPILGLGEGGPQYNRRGNDLPMTSSQDAYDKPHFGGRLPIGWIMGDGWALFLHTPDGAINFNGEDGKFTSKAAASPLPIDIFVVGFKEPAEALTEYARITGFPSMPPVWALGYQQSYRTITSWQMVSTIARTFREKNLPCDVHIYLGTGWAPSGWNTGHRSFTFNPSVFPDPAEDIRKLHEMHFEVVLHEMGPPRGLTGQASDNPHNDDPNEVANYWAKHAPLEKLGVDGWWPDEGENLSPASRLARIRMYWEGPQIDRPNVRPYTLNRAGDAGMQRMGGWLWSGDTNSTWETLTNQVPIGINTSLSGVPFWGTDIGGFFSTKELSGELFARWFEFDAFTPLFRAHGRPSATRYPWSWNSGEMGEPELAPEVHDSALPDLKELHNPAIEPICRKYLNLRYRLMPYLYSAADEAHETGLPIMRALWMYYRNDPVAAGRGDEYLWGRDILVAPVTEKSAAARTLYLPRGTWYDFWTNEKVEGGKEVTRPVDLATIPLYMRAGAIIPMGPLKQYTTEKVAGPLTLTVYPGADGHFVLYDDDGVSFDYQKGLYTRVEVSWDDQARRLTILPEHVSGTWNEISKRIEVRLATGGAPKHMSFSGQRQSVQF